MRVFIAAELPEELTEALAETSAALRACVSGRYVGTDSFHITLAFLGSVESPRIDAAADALHKACWDQAPIPVTLGDWGSFGRNRSAALWQGLHMDEGRKALEALAARVRDELTTAGFAFDTKTFVPHITLMRAAKLEDGLLPAPVQAQGTIDTITLFESDLSGVRPVYHPLEQVVLRG